MAKTLSLPNHIFFRLDAQYRLITAVILAAGSYFLTGSKLSTPAKVLVTWIVFALTVIILDWIIILKAHPREIKKIASLQDSSRTMIFLFAVVASIFSLGAILFLLKTTKGQPETIVNAHILLALTSVIVSWWLVHTLFTLRYAHMYYDTETDDGTPIPLGGLLFPEEKEPDYLDFVYFAFVIGMTFQVSDVNITSRYIRRLAWLHGLLSFAFNTAIVALSINIISSMI